MLLARAQPVDSRLSQQQQQLGLDRCSPRKSDRDRLRLGVPSFECKFESLTASSWTPGWVSVNAFAHVQLRMGARARVPVVCPCVDTFGAAREE